MSVSTIKVCVWCGEQTPAQHQNKVVCSDTCRKAFARWREKLHIQNATAFIYLEGIKLFGGRHPNPNYKENNEQSMPVLQ